MGASTALGRRLCGNRLCHTTGEYEVRQYLPRTPHPQWLLIHLSCTTLFLAVSIGTAMVPSEPIVISLKLVPRPSQLLDGPIFAYFLAFLCFFAGDQPKNDGEVLRPYPRQIHHIPSLRRTAPDFLRIKHIYCTSWLQKYREAYYLLGDYWLWGLFMREVNVYHIEL